jgi:quercetin dioxygenase-like cupin family protein
MADEQDLVGKPFEPGGVADYAPGAIVSRTVLKKKAGNLTVFSFDAGEGLTEHVSPFDAVVQILDGRAEITIGGKPLTAEAGQMVILPAGVPHALQARERFKMLLIMIRSPAPTNSPADG